MKKTTASASFSPNQQCVCTVHTIALKRIKININFQKKKKASMCARAHQRISSSRLTMKQLSFCILISIHLAYGFLSPCVWSEMAKMCRLIWKICKLHLNRNSTAMNIWQCVSLCAMHSLYIRLVDFILICIRLIRNACTIFLWSTRVQMHSVTVD